MPRSIRSTKSAVIVSANPDNRVAADQIRYPAPKTHATENRSTSHPAMDWQNAYDQKNADKSKPSWLGDNPNSAVRAGAAMDRLPRSI
jgi:hypothetical protein